MTTDPALIERMERLVRDLTRSRSCYAVEARAIVELLPDKDKDEATRIIAMYRDSDYPSFGLEAAIADAVQYGRNNPA